MRRLGLVLRFLVGLFFVFSAVGMFVDVEAVARDLQLEQWFLVTVVIIKFAGALAMLASFWNKRLAIASGLLFVAIMLGALVTHIRIDDPISNMILPAVLLIGSALTAAITFWEDLELRDSLASRIAVQPDYVERRQENVQQRFVGDR